MAGLIRTYALPGAATRRQQAKDEAQRVRVEVAAARLRQRVQAQVAAELEAEKTGAVYARSRRSWVRPVRAALWRGRAALRPVYALAGLYVAGWAVWAASMPPAAAVLLTAILTVGWWRLRLARRLDRNVERTYAAVCLFGGWLWLCSCVAASPLGREYQLLWTWIVAAWIWWGLGRHWPSDWRPPVEITAPDEEDTYRRRWEAKLAAPGRRLSGSQVLTVAYDEHDAEVLIVQVEPGVHDVESVTMAADNVSSGLRVPQERIIIERAPEEHNPGDDPTLVQVKVLPRSPIKQIQWFHHPRYDSGKVLLGHYLDGIGEGTWRIYEKGRMWGGSLWAGTGYGKTRVLESLAVSVRAPWFQERYPTTIVYLDGQNGASSPLMWENATVHGGVEDADEILDGLIRVGEMRQKWNRLHGLTAFYPGKPPAPGVEGLSGILVIVDEQHGIFHRGNIRRWERVAREFGKLGMAVIGADQITDLSAYGGSDVLRSSMLAGNGGAMHIASRTAGNLVPGLPVDPYRLPKIPGYLVKISDSASGDRTAPLQVRYMPDEQARDRGLAIPDGVRLAEEWFPLGSEAALGEMDAREFGPVYTQRHEREERRREELLAAIQGITLHAAPETEPPAREVDDDAVAEATAKVVPIGSAGMSRAQRIAHGRQILARYAQRTPEAAEYDTHMCEQFDAQQPAQDTRSTRDVVRDYLREHGRAKRADIIAHVQQEIDTSVSAVKQVLGSMKDKGEITAENGVYVWLDAA